MPEDSKLIEVRKHGKGDVLLASAKQVAAHPKLLVPVDKAMKEAAAPAPVADVPVADTAEPEDVAPEPVGDGDEPPTLTRKDMTKALRAKGHKVATKLTDDEVTAMFVEHCGE